MSRGLHTTEAEGVEFNGGMIQTIIRLSTEVTKQGDKKLKSLSLYSEKTGVMLLVKVDDKVAELLEGIVNG